MIHFGLANLFALWLAFSRAVFGQVELTQYPAKPTKKKKNRNLKFGSDAANTV